ncbi:hypothetical protein BGM26_18010 [Bacillus sp. FJAT-29790]|uniref:hypothetical protein n=1 Tax=Bacillus sp. FJAT-29790 TaxID=1895002 RepID=UPI001C237300|nr:hypothetical protein [Bacillus sp. FJAT-29790]MBU8880851.1 hypothetical protein [Bacillus sp. FJAT-29790]
MKWGIFLGVLLFIGLIGVYERPKMKKYPRKDKIAFFTLLTMAGILSLFDLPNMPGPVTFLESIFKPIRRFMEG